MKWIAKAVAGLLMVLLMLTLSPHPLRQTRPDVPTRLGAVESQTQGFQLVVEPRPLRFPMDHGPHPEYQTEWWYYTGNLETSDGRHFGYQLTFFRRSLVPPSLRADRVSSLATDQVYMAHLALTDVAGRRFRAFERFSRAAGGLAGARATPYHVWLEDWGVLETGPDAVRLRAAQEDLAVDLLLVSGNRPVLQGDRGYSRKGSGPGNASYYYSQTRLESSGTVRVGSVIHHVAGLSWMDHEFGTSSLGPGQVGWDWFALQLNGGSELMVFHIRRADGSVDAFSSGMWIAPDGSTRQLSRGDFEISVEDTWRSSETGATYPARWTVRVPSAELMLNVVPYLADQELDVSIAYWEGAVRIEGRRADFAVSGSGYVELTGYAHSMRGWL